MPHAGHGDNLKNVLRTSPAAGLQGEGAVPTRRQRMYIGVRGEGTESARI